MNALTKMELEIVASVLKGGCHSLVGQGPVTPGLPEVVLARLQQDLLYGLARRRVPDHPREVVPTAQIDIRTTVRDHEAELIRAPPSNVERADRTGRHATHSPTCMSASFCRDRDAAGDRQQRCEGTLAVAGALTGVPDLD